MFYYFAREKETDRNEIDLNLDLSDNQSELLNDLASTVDRRTITVDINCNTVEIDRTFDNRLVFVL